MKTPIRLFLAVVLLTAVLTPSPMRAEVFSCADVSEIPQVECEALVAFYQSTNGDYWNTNTNWLVTNTPSDWYGITATGGFVTGISLEYNYTYGPLPAEFANLSHLQSINLIGDSLIGTIPVELGSLSSLQHLALGNNMFTGTIPAELGNLSNLQHLDLSWNWNLTGTIPTE